MGSRAELAVSELETRDSSFVHRDLSRGDAVDVQYRAHGEVARARVSESQGGSVRVRFDRPVEAVAPGQSAVFYGIDEPREVLGGGYIASTRGARDVA